MPLPIGTPGLRGTHLANSYDDTSEGSIHYFQDERGNWQTYCFAEKPSTVLTGMGIPATDQPTSQVLLRRTDLSLAPSEPRQGMHLVEGMEERPFIPVIIRHLKLLPFNNCFHFPCAPTSPTSNIIDSIVT